MEKKVLYQKKFLLRLPPLFFAKLIRSSNLIFERKHIEKYAKIYSNINMQFKDLYTQSKLKYENFESVICPALNIKVNFNAKGFNHLTFKNPRNPRNIGDQMNRLKLLDLMFEFIQHTNTFQEYEKIETEGQKVKEYWGLIAIYKNKKLKVILRKIGNGEVHFWSVIPAYTTSEKRDGNFKMKGDADKD